MSNPTTTEQILALIYSVAPAVIGVSFAVLIALVIVAIWAQRSSHDEGHRCADCNGKKDLVTLRSGEFLCWDCQMAMDKLTGRVAR